MLILTRLCGLKEDGGSESCQKCTLSFFDQEVVNQARHAKARGQQRQAGTPQSRHWLQCFRVYQLHVVRLRQRLAPDDFANRGCEPESVAFAALDRTPCSIERAVKDRRGAPLIRR